MRCNSRGREERGEGEGQRKRERKGKERGMEERGRGRREGGTGEERGKGGEERMMIYYGLTLPLSLSTSLLAINLGHSPIMTSRWADINILSNSAATY